MFCNVGLTKKFLGTSAAYALFCFALSITAEAPCAAHQNTTNKTLMFYKVGKQENLGQLLFRLRLFPLWGAKSTVKQICELNKKTISHDCNIVQENSKLYIPLEMLSGKYLNYQVDRQTTQIFIHKHPETSTPQRALAGTATLPPETQSVPSRAPQPDLNSASVPAPVQISTSTSKQMPSIPLQETQPQVTIPSKPSVPVAAVATGQVEHDNQPVLFDLGASTFFSEYNSTDISNNVSSHFASKLNFELNSGISYVWNKQLQNRFYFNQQRIAFQDVEYPVANLSAFGLQNTFYSTHGISISANGGARQIVILRSGAFDKKFIPHLGSEVALTLLKLDMISASLALGAEYLFGNSASSTYSIKSGYAYDIKLQIHKSKNFNQLGTEFFYHSENQNTSISKQNSNSMGIRINYNFGGIF